MFDVHQHHSSQATSDPAFQKLLMEFAKMAQHAKDVLYDYDIEPFDAPVGEEYNAKTHKVVAMVETDKPEQAKKVIRSLKPGFMDIANNRLVQLAEVEIFKLKN